MFWSLDDMDSNIVERIAGFCLLGDAARLSITSKRYSILITRLLPALCDTGDLRLLVQDRAADVRSLWWGLSIWDEARKSSQLVVTSLDQRCEYYMTEWDRLSPKGEAPFEICDPYRPSDLSLEVIRTIVSAAGAKFTWKKAQITVKLFLKQTGGEVFDHVSCDEIAKAMQHRTMLQALNYVCEACGPKMCVSREVAQERLTAVVLSQDRHWKSLQKHCQWPIDNVHGLGWLLQDKLVHRKKLDFLLVKKVFCMDSTGH